MRYVYFVALLLAAPGQTLKGQTPAEVQDLIGQFDKDKKAIQDRAEAEIQARRGKLVQELQAVQDRYTKAGQFDEAQAVRDVVRALQKQLTPTQHNPLFQELIKEGLDIGARSKPLFPPPTMADGLDAAGQKKVLEKLIDKHSEYDDFVRNSPVAPLVLRIRNIDPADPQAPAYGVDVAFVVHGDWNKISKAFLDKAFTFPLTATAVRPLTIADLAKRKIAMSADQANQSFDNRSYSLRNKVELSCTVHSCCSQTAESFIVAQKIDPRFLKDAEFPNQWRSMKKDKDDKTVLGPVEPYQGAGGYLKLTRLREPAGAIFVEAHLIFTEPKGWFDGENYLRSKLPLAAPYQVRALRQELLKPATP